MAGDDDQADDAKRSKKQKPTANRAAARVKSTTKPAPGKVAATDSLQRPYDAERREVEASPDGYGPYGGPKGGLTADQGRTQFRRGLAYFAFRNHPSYPFAMSRWLQIRNQYHPAVRDLIDLHMSGLVDGLAKHRIAELERMLQPRYRPSVELQSKLAKEGATEENLTALKDSPRSSDAARAKGLRHQDAQHRRGDAVTRTKYHPTELPGGRNGLLGFGIGDRGTNQRVQARLEEVIVRVMRETPGSLASKRNAALQAAKAESAKTKPIPGIAKLDEAEARIKAGKKPVVTQQPGGSAPAAFRPRPVAFGVGAALLVIDYLNWYASLDNPELRHAVEVNRSRLFQRMGGKLYETTSGNIYLPPTGAALDAWFDANIRDWKQFHDFWNFEARGILVRSADDWGLFAGRADDGMDIIQPVTAEVARLFERLDRAEQQAIGATAKTGARALKFRDDATSRTIWYADGGPLARLIKPLVEGNVPRSAKFLVVRETTAVRPDGIGSFYEVRGGDVYTSKLMQGRTGLINTSQVEDAR